MSPRRSAKPYRVLLVEDSRSDARLLREGLRYSPHAAFDVSDVGTLAEATERLERSEPDVIVLDLGLPDAVGTSGLVALHEMVPHVPIVVLTGRSADDDIAMEVLRAGAQDYMSKADDDWEQLGRTLSYAIERHGVHRKLRTTTEELQAANARLEERVRVDPLTGLLNRRGLAGALPGVLAAAEREGMLPFALMADLDDFQRVNDRLGYSMGDILMREVAARVRRAMGREGHCGRLGGDELLLLFLVERDAEAWHMAERIRLALTEDIPVFRRGPVRMTASFALVRLDEEHDLLDRVTASASKALEVSKRLGKNRLSRYSAGNVDEEDLGERERAVAGLTQSANFHRVRQTIVRLEDESVVGYEYLSRFAFPPYERPRAFLSLAAEVDLSTAVDHLCFRACLDEVRADASALRGHLNLLPATLLGFSDEHLAELLHDLDPSRVCVEISEQEIVGDVASLREGAELLRRAGVGLALDDVGFGRSSLESLVLLEPSAIKLDERCIQGAADDADKRHILERLLAICRTIDAQVIAEGVETEAERDLLRDLGVGLAQGYLWDRPG